MNYHWPLTYIWPFQKSSWVWKSSQIFFKIFVNLKISPQIWKKIFMDLKKFKCFTDLKKKVQKFGKQICGFEKVHEFKENFQTNSRIWEKVHEFK